MMLPQVPRELILELLRPEAIRADETWQASLRMLEPHQMLILVLTRESNDAYASWNRLQAMYPTGTDRTDVQTVERRAITGWSCRWSPTSRSCRRTR